MNKTYPLALHIFRRDLRLDDNTALMAALNLSEKVIPCFIFDKRQIDDNDYKGEHCLSFMAHSLQALDTALRQKQSRLYFFYGIAEDVIETLLSEIPIKSVFINRDYTPFSSNRDNKIKAHCDARGVDFHCFADALLHEPEQVVKSDGTPYTVFTHAFKKASQFAVTAPKENHSTNYYQDKLIHENASILDQLLTPSYPGLLINGGRKEALNLLRKIKGYENYDKSRQYPALHGTTYLSAHHKFGTISIRETYATTLKAFDSRHGLITELYWRDFFTHIAFHFPRVFGHAFHQQYDHLPWSQNEKHFRAWCEGRTGFPIVDAGMRQLNLTGYMHNRVRMIVASFLTKDLHIDWRLGEKYFAQQLVDYDASVNNGNWQWAASTGCDAQPYFRIFNPWLQQKKFDPDCVYIKHYVPELAKYSPRDIHELCETPLKEKSTYPRPIVNHAIESTKAKAMYKNANVS